MTGNKLNICLIVVTLVGLGCGCPERLKQMSEKQENVSTPRPTPSRSSTSDPSPKGEYSLSIEKYDKIKVGMPRPQVENTLGGKGTEISSSVGGGVKFSVDKWEGDGFKSIILSFRNDKVMSKSQVGLK